MSGDITPRWAERFIKADADRKLSTEGRIFATHLKDTTLRSPVDIMADRLTDMSSESMRQLDLEISKTKNPEILDILNQERDRIVGMIQEENKKATKVSPAKTKDSSQDLLNSVGSILMGIFGAK